MTRKDTIIVAALLNAGLLVILFVSAVKSEDVKKEVAPKEEVTPLVSAELPFKSDAKRVMGDEVDQVLSQYTKKDPLQEPAQQQTGFLVEEVTTLTLPTPVKEEVAVASPAPEYVEVKVKKGDALEKIARQHRTTVSEIMKLNSLSSTQLKIGQVLKVPAHKEEKKSSPKVPLDPTSAKYYTVKPGDNPWTIAVKNHMKVEELLQLNNMDAEKARKLKPGDQIRIR